MSETIHIFDEFPQTADELSESIRHQKRMRLEPLVFDILKRKYGSVLKGFWDKHEVPTEGDKAIVVVERRIHENLEFVLHNAAYFAPNWQIFIVCSAINLPWLRHILGHNGNRVKLFPFFTGSPDRDTARNEYNSLLKSPDFYSSLPAEHLFFMQTDSYLRKPLPDTILKYDHVAAPLLWEQTSVGGGMSYRRKTSMIKICSEFTSKLIGEDCYINAGVKELGYTIPRFEEGLELIAESCLYEDPVGVHQWWTYFFDYGSEDSQVVFHSLLTLQV